MDSDFQGKQLAVKTASIFLCHKCWAERFGQIIFVLSDVAMFGGGGGFCDALVDL